MLVNLVSMAAGAAMAVSDAAARGAGSSIEDNEVREIVFGRGIWVSGVDGVKHVISTVSDGVSMTTVMFRLDANPATALADVKAAAAYGVIRARARADGKAIGVADGYIAAIATAHDLAVATRDTSPFVAAGLQVISP